MKSFGKIFTFYVIILFILLDFAMGSLFAKYMVKLPLAPTVEYRQSHLYYHHGLKPNKRTYDFWGFDQASKYLICTNSLGFKDFYVRNIMRSTPRKRVLFMGDSFTEGVGCTFQDTFVGVIAYHTDSTRVDVLNAGCVSYSPKLYYLKTKFLIEHSKLTLNDLFVFVDISDMQDEMGYEGFKPEIPSRYGEHNSAQKEEVSIKNRIKDYMARHSVIGGLYLKWSGGRYNEQRVLWTIDKKSQGEWIIKAMRLADNNMQLLVNYCKERNINLHIAIYPWPNQILVKATTDLNVRFWTGFCVKNHVDLINYYPDFINSAPANDVIDKNFLKGDVHWNKNGHSLIAHRIIKSYSNIFPHNK